MRTLSLIIQEIPLELAPLQEPEAVQFTFETIGWAILGFLFLVSTCFIIYKLLIHFKKNTYRRNAIKEILTLENQFKKDQNNLQLNKTLVIMKQVAITTFGRKEVAQLYGIEWLQFLDSKVKNNSFTKYNETISGALNASEKCDVKNTEAVFELTKKWIKTHA